MTGPEHYRAAERLVDQAHHWTYGDGADPVVGAALAAEALVHAKLAQTAVMALALRGEMPPRDADAWLQIVATSPEPTS